MVSGIRGIDDISLYSTADDSGNRTLLLYENREILKSMLYIHTIITIEKREDRKRKQEECIRDNILREFLLRQRAEVVKMSIYEYDEEREMKLIRADEREIGREEERKNTDEALKKFEKEKENSIKTAISLCKEFGSTKAETAAKLMEKCELSHSVAEEKVSVYWDN